MHCYNKSNTHTHTRMLLRPHSEASGHLTVSIAFINTHMFHYDGGYVCGIVIKAPIVLGNVLLVTHSDHTSI